MEQLALEGFVDLSRPRDERGRFLAAPRQSKSLAPPESAEVATVNRAEFLSGFGTRNMPNFSPVIRYRSNGQGIAFYDTMWFTDADMAGFFLNLNDDVLHCESLVQAASDSAEHREHQAFAIFALKSLTDLQSIKRHFLSAHAFGFSVSEKMYTTVDRGPWKGAIIFSSILDKPQRWFTFDTKRRIRFVTSNQPDGEPLPQEKFVVNTFGTNSNPWGEPVLDLCYWPWRLKHEALKNQGLWYEKWASPTVKGKYKWSPQATTNLQNRNKLIEVGMSIQTDQFIAMPEGMDIDLLESTRSGAISYDSYISQLNQALSRIVTGQLLSSMGLEGGSYALGKVHAKQEANKVEMLAAWLDGILTRLIRELIDRVFGFQDAYPRHTTIAKSALERQSEVTIQSSLQQLGVKYSESYTNRKFYVVAPKDKADELTPPEGVSPSQTLPVTAGLAAYEMGGDDQPRVPAGDPDGGQWTSGGYVPGSWPSADDLTSPGGHMSARARAAANRRFEERLFGPGGLKQPGVPEPTIPQKIEVLRARAADFRHYAAGGMKPRVHTKKAIEFDALADTLQAELQGLPIAPQLAAVEGTVA